MEQEQASRAELYGQLASNETVVSGQVDGLSPDRIIAVVDGDRVEFRLQLWDWDFDVEPEVQRWETTGECPIGVSSLSLDAVRRIAALLPPVR